MQATVVAHLVGNGWTIRRVANTSIREHGHDIEAERDNVILWVTVKGFPERTPKTQPATQARHWFADALFDVILRRQEAPSNVSFAIALPVFQTYETLAARTEWLSHTVPFTYFWVTELGVVQN